MIEDLDDLVLDRRFRQQLGRREQCLACARCRLEAQFGVRLEQVRQHLPQGLRDVLGSLRSAVLGEVLDQALRVRLGAGEQVHRDQADREEVPGEVRLGTQHLLRCEVTGRTHHVIGVGQPRLALAHRDAEVGQPHVRPAGPGRLQQDVRGLDVTVHDAFRVDRGQPRQQLVEQDTHQARRQRPVVPHEVGQRTAVHQVHGEQDLVVVRGPAGGGQYVRVVDPYGLFADEPQQRVRVALLEHLGRHVTAPPLVPGAPHGSHAAPPDRVDQLVPTGEDLTHCAPSAYRTTELPDFRGPSRAPGRSPSNSGGPRSGRPRPRCAPLRRP